MRLQDLTWAVHKVFGGWQGRNAKQARHALPPDCTAMVLRRLRSTACRDEAPTKIECAKWTQTDPYPPDPAVFFPLRKEQEKKGPFLTAAGYVCDQCKHPHVPHETLMAKLGLDLSERIWHRYLKAERPMPTDQLRRAVAHAFGQSWLGMWQTFSIFKHIDELEATRRGLLAVFQRARERKAHIERQELNVSPAELEKEFKKQGRILDREAIRMIDQRLKAGNLPPDVLQLMQEVLFSGKKP